MPRRAATSSLAERTISDFPIAHKREQTNICSLLCFPIKKIRAIMNPATGECRFTPFVGVMCVTLFEKLSLLIAAATLAVNIIFLIK